LVGSQVFLTDILDKRGISVACLRRLRVFGPSIPTIVGYSHFYESGGILRKILNMFLSFLASTNSVVPTTPCLGSNTCEACVLVQMRSIQVSSEIVTLE